METKTCKRGLGLCLSGGGFRASFFHIGVLARMADLGMLRHVEVISTVSGGSIVGAAYYLLVKELLETKRDTEIEDADYARIVARLETHFLGAVQKNLRMRTFANPYKNLKMIRADYSRSDAIGELYEKYIYKPLIKIERPRIEMNDLLIIPREHRGGMFHPCDENVGNATRRHKVPILVLNATSLNSGHNWIFTAASMGEVPPRNLNFRDIDKKDRYRRVRYEEIRTRRPSFYLGSAVAASAGVPGLFPPMAVSGLYKDRRVQLVDGGVFDNQGIVSLLDPDHTCSDFVVSDASGQSDATDNPDTRFAKVLGTATGILTGRVREEVVNNLQETQSGRVAYFHLTRGLFARNIEFNEQPVQDEPGKPMMAGIVPSLEEFGIHEDMQRALAHVRTDLDSFTDLEAGCLEADAYLMSDNRLRASLDSYIAPVEHSEQWSFNRYSAALASNDPTTRRHLEIASFSFFKPLLHALSGGAGFVKSLGLLAVSLPLVVSLAVIAYLVDLAVRAATSYGIWSIVTDAATFEKFLSEWALTIYGIIVAFVLSAIADFFIEGIGKWADRIRKLLRSPMALIVGTIIRVILPVVFAIPILVYLYTIDLYFVRVLAKRE